MTMVKLPTLEFEEVQRIVNALKHCGDTVCVAQGADAAGYARLADMLELRLNAQRTRVSEYLPVRN
jgi:hypothetical protein